MIGMREEQAVEQAPAPQLAAVRPLLVCFYFRSYKKEIRNMEQFETSKGEYVISTDKSRLDLNVIHEFLSKRSYWA